MSNDTMRENNLEKVRTINEVPGFNAECYAIPYTDLNTGEVRRRLPFMPLLAWFRLKYPEGKIACSVTKENDCFIGSARIYCSYKDPLEQYISEATVSRSYCEDKPSVSPREWAQTAAISVALRNAGFGLQFDMVSDDYSATAPNEFTGNASAERAATETPDAYETTGDSLDSGTDVTVPPETKKLSMDEEYEAACKIPCPIKKYEGRTLGDLILLDPKALKWIAEKYEGNAETKAAAVVICEYAMLHAG